MNAVVVFIF